MSKQDTLETRIASTWAQALTTKVVSPDDFRIENGRYVHRPEEQGPIWGASYDLLRTLVKLATTHTVVALIGVPGAGKSTWLSQNRQEGVVYFDATLASPRDRRRLLAAIRAAQAQVRKDLRVEAVWIDTPLEVCKSRNASRTPDRQVPEHVLESMALRLSETPPESGEGWDSLQVVR